MILAAPGPSPQVGNEVLLEAQLDDLLDEMYYVNLHSADNAAGELRTQVLTDAGMLDLFAFSARILFLFGHFFEFLMCSPSYYFLF